VGKLVGEFKDTESDAIANPSVDRENALGKRVQFPREYIID
jgi:hypothetical protein